MKTKDLKTYIRISSEIDSKVEKFAQELGMSKSSLMAYYIGEGVLNEERKRSMMSFFTSENGLETITKALGFDFNEVMEKGGNDY